MEIRKIRMAFGQGKTIYDLPLRVTFYARVSTEKQTQRNSLDNQVQHYEALIAGQKNWDFVTGYVDEGISGTSTKGRTNFNQMILDAETGRFDLILTKEISRFSRSTLDSIQYTQRLLACNVGVLFENDNLNTLDPDSEFRLVIMAGVAQDEVRRLSERLKFGFRQAIQNGHVLGNNQMWGYEKQRCALRIRESEAEMVRLIFSLYAEEKMGLRKIAQHLFTLGYASRNGTPLSALTVRNILCNPKYKGWYCGNKTQSTDYRSKKRTSLDPAEWVLHPDPEIPPIVSEQLWDQANALYQQRSGQMRGHASAACFHNRYPYSGKIFCQMHNTPFHRQKLTSARGVREVWQCKIYRAQGRRGCAAPQLSTQELDRILGAVLSARLADPARVVQFLLHLLERAAGQTDTAHGAAREIARLTEKKKRLLELYLDGGIEKAAFCERQAQLQQTLERAARAQQEMACELSETRRAQIAQALEQLVCIAPQIDSALAAAVLERVTVERESSKAQLQLQIQLKDGTCQTIVYDREKSSLRFLR